MTRFWNNLPHVRSMSKDLKLKYFNSIWEKENQTGQPNIQLRLEGGEPQLVLTLGDTIKVQQTV